MPRLLLVEDGLDAALLVECLGRRMGLDVLHRVDVASAWECLREALPDLILLDLNLPRERGEVLCRRVRATPEIAGVSIALFVHWSCPEDIISGLDAGADHIVAKDLLAQPAVWQARLSDILAGRDRLSGPSLINSPRNLFLPQPPLEGLAALNRALRHPLVRQLGTVVVRYLLHRAVGRAGSETDWLEADGLALDVQHVAAVAETEAVVVFADAVADLLQRFLGTEASAPVQEALRDAVNCLSG